MQGFYEDNDDDCLSSLFTLLDKKNIDIVDVKDLKTVLSAMNNTHVKKEEISSIVDKANKEGDG